MTNGSALVSTVVTTRTEHLWERAKEMELRENTLSAIARAALMRAMAYRYLGIEKEPEIVKLERLAGDIDFVLRQAKQ